MIRQKPAKASSSGETALDLTIHIGLHKTDTTTLQRDAFPRCSDLNYLGGETVGRFEQASTTSDPIYFDADA